MTKLRKKAIICENLLGDGMNGYIVFEYDENCQRIKYLFEDAPGKEFDYLIWVTLPYGRKINIAKIKQGLNKYFLRKLNGKKCQKDFPERAELLQIAYENDWDIVDNCSEIRITGTTEIPIEDYPNLDDKKIVLTAERYPLDIKTVETLEEKYKEYKNVYVQVDENEEPISLENYRKIVEMLTEVVNKIKSYNLSPLEQVIYAFDYARDKIYQKENSWESYSKSRDLSNALLTKKIVCVGYARIFSTILNMLGINSTFYAVTGKEPHMISIAHIKDEKYGVNGIYFFDPTMDRKRDNTNDHFNRYMAFGKTLDEMMYFAGFKDETFGEPQETYYESIITAVKNNETTYEMNKKYKYIVNMSRFIEGLPLKIVPYYIGGNSREEIYSNPNIMTNVKQCFRLLYSKIDPVILIEAVAKVRKIQYYENSDKFSFSTEILSDIASNSYWHNYYCWNHDPLDKMLRDNQESYDKDSAGVDLIKVLKKVKEQKEKSDQ